MATKPVSTAERIAELTRCRDQLREEHEIVSGSPRSLDEAVADIDKVVQGLRTRVEMPVAWLARGQAGYGDLIHELGNPRLQERGATTPFAMAAWLAPEQLAAAVERDLRQIYSTLPKAMPTAARLAEQRRLQGEIAALEEKIAATWWQAIDEGAQLPAPDIGGGILIGLSAE